MKIALRNLRRRFGTGEGAVDAVRDVTLDVEDSELFVLLGPSGCGKSTLLELCAGLQRPDAGEIRFGDRLMAAPERKTFVPPKQRDVAMVFQSYALYPHMSVFDNIAFPLRIARKGREAIETAVTEAAGMLDITELLDRRPAALSGGQRQRVAIARAIVRHPSVFLLDEPLSNLDAQRRTSMRAELKQLQRRLGVTTLYVTHDQTEAMTLGDRIALMRDGEVVQIGTPEDLYERPATAFAATFLGSFPMNLVPARVEAGAEGPVIAQAGDTRIRLDRASDCVHVGKGGDALLGIRPERLQIAPAAADDGEQGVPGLGGRVVTVETLGREVLYHVELTGAEPHRLAVLTTDRGIGEGTKVLLRFRPGDVHLFPPDRDPPWAHQE